MGSAGGERRRLAASGGVWRRLAGIAEAHDPLAWLDAGQLRARTVAALVALHQAEFKADDKNELLTNPRGKAKNGDPNMLSTYIVEDDPATRAALIELLEATGAVKVAGWAATELEAVRWLTENPDRWSLLIVDYQLAQGNGLRVLATCRVRASQQRAVLLTAHGSAELRRRCLDLGADRVFDKAAGLEPLLAMCEQWNRRASALRSSADTPLEPFAQ